MRLLVRIVIFWAICAPLFYWLALPWLLGKFELKARAQNYAMCETHLQSEGMAGTPTAILKPAQADEYCHCVSDRLTFVNADLFDLALHKPPTHLNATMKPIVEGCNKALEEIMNNTVQSAPPPNVERLPDGTEVIHFR